MFFFGNIYGWAALLFTRMVNFAAKAGLLTESVTSLNAADVASTRPASAELNKRPNFPRYYRLALELGKLE
jgi:hypothetical protein